MSESRRQSSYRRVVGLSYGGTEAETPAVTIKGEHFEADELVKIAKRFGIPVVEKGEVARALDALEEGQEIPESLYEAVAVILSSLEGGGL